MVLGPGCRAPSRTPAHPTPGRYGLRNTLEPLSGFFLSLSLLFLSLLDGLGAFGSAGAPGLTSTSCPACEAARRGRASGELVVVVAPGVTGPTALAPLASRARATISSVLSSRSMITPFEDVSMCGPNINPTRRDGSPLPSPGASATFAGSGSGTGLPHFFRVSFARSAYSE